MATIHTLPECFDPHPAPPVALRPQGRPMPYKLTIELSDRDLRHFRRELKKARDSVRIADDEEILGAVLSPFWCRTSPVTFPLESFTKVSWASITL